MNWLNFVRLQNDSILLIDLQVDMGMLSRSQTIDSQQASSNRLDLAQLQVAYDQIKVPYL